MNNQQILNMYLIYPDFRFNSDDIEVLSSQMEALERYAETFTCDAISTDSLKRDGVERLWQRIQRKTLEPIFPIPHLDLSLKSDFIAFLQILAHLVPIEKKYTSDEDFKLRKTLYKELINIINKLEEEQ